MKETTIRGLRGRFSFYGESGVAPASSTEARKSGRSAGKRRAEFEAGRRCARKALEALGRVTSEIPIGPCREPVWPDGITGSISHTDGFTCAWVTDCGASLGIDAERIDGAPPDGVWKRIMGPGEEIQCRSDSERIVVFSAKETLYKALFPFVGRYFDFRAAEFRSRWDGTFELAVRSDLGAYVHRDARFRGRYAARGGLVLTWLAMQKPAGAFEAGGSYGLRIAPVHFPAHL